ncbi:hypothetical protein BpHYR1_013412 [Brachionus plicatilis]|uniref:Uncharacterized protein n=1 Tax=Brachionus plicatilis TaxID=10195 RepID=A0A3M7P1R2_BRAPC|nr:hypothetical protein BpHYR1_013412 [Brachionus plicatilis]
MNFIVGSDLLFMTIETRNKGLYQTGFYTNSNLSKLKSDHQQAKKQIRPPKPKVPKKNSNIIDQVDNLNLRFKTVGSYFNNTDYSIIDIESLQMNISKDEQSIESSATLGFRFVIKKCKKSV